MHYRKILVIFTIWTFGITITGCATYTAQTKQTIGMAKDGNLDEALALLEQKNASADKDILYYLEKGELLRMKAAFSDSRDSLLVADEKVRSWEDKAKNDPSKLLGSLGTILVNDSTTVYDGRDYEKVFLSVRLALNHLTLGDWASARVEIKKMHEREAIIRDYRAKELLAAADKVKEKKLQATSFKELDGYPIETLDDPEVRALANSYESAFANYLAGFVYETQGDISLAAPGYRKAAEMQPHIPLIDEGLAGLESRTKAVAKDKLVDTLIIIETGEAPEIQSRSLPVPVPTPNGILLTAMSWPVIMPEISPQRPSDVRLDGQPVKYATLTGVNLMARRALSEEMPGIVARTSVRAISRAIGQYALDNAASRSSGSTSTILSVISLVSKVGSVATEAADTRTWRTLPGYYTVARARLAPGPHTVTISVNGLPTAPVTLDIAEGRYAVTDVRIYGAVAYVANQTRLTH